MDTIADYNDWKSKRQQNGIGAASVILGSVNAAPDELAGDLNLASEFSKTTGNPVPPAPMVKEYRNVFQQAIEREKNKTILSQSPRLTDWLRNPDNAALSRDDLPGLSWFEGFGRGAVATGQRAVERLSQMGNQAMLEQTAGRARDRKSSFGQILDSERDTIKSPDGDVKAWVNLSDLIGASMRYVDARFADMIGTDDEVAAAGFAANIKAAQDAIAATPKSEIATSFEKQAMAPGASFGEAISNITTAFLNNPMGGLSWAVETAGESAPQIAAAVGVSIATRNPAAGLGVLGGGSYLTERYTAPADFLAEKGIDLGNPIDVQRVISDPKILEDAANRGVIRGAIIGAFDLASGGLAGRALAGNPFVEAFAQMAQQAILGSAGEYSARVAAGQPVDWNDVLAEGLAEIATAPVDMGVAGREFTISRRKSEDAENRRVMFEQLSGQAGASVLRNRMPDKFREFVAAATANGPVENVFVPAEQFSTYFQGIGVDPYALVDDLDGVTRDDLDAALAGGGDLKIPTATYAAKIAGSEHDAFLMENMRFDPDQFTATEAAEFNARAEDAMQEAFELAEQLRQHEESLRTFEQEIYDTMVSRLRAAGRSTDVATTEAMLYPAFYRTMAERSGLTVDEFMAKYPLPQVEGERPEGMQAKDVDALTRTLAEARSRRAVGLDKRQSLLEFISDHGGINDVGGELRSRDAEVVKRGRKNLKLARKGVVAGVRDMLGGDGGKKHGVDDVAQAAIEAGFLANDPVVIEYQNAVREGRQVPDIGRALMAAIGRELGGTMEFSSAQAVDQNTADNEAMLDQIEVYLNRIGVGLDDSDEAIRAAVQADQESEGRKYGQDDGKKLIVQHNLSSANLIHADKMRGLAVPSVAISNVDYPLDNFGEITLLGGADLIDPRKDSSAKVFDADVYSPRYPTVRYKVAKPAMSKVWKRLGNVSDELGNVLSSEIDEGEVQRNGLAAFRDSSAVQLDFLRSTGRDIDLPQNTARSDYLTMVPELANMPVDTYGMTHEPGVKEAVEKAIDLQVQRLHEAAPDVPLDEWRDQFYFRGEIRRSVLEEINQEKRVLRNPGVDRGAARRALRDAIQPYSDEFAAWVDAQFGDVIAGETVQTETASGDLKYLPHTLDNVVKILRKKLRDGEGFNYGVGSIRSTVANQFKSVSAIQKARGRLIPADDMKAVKDEVDNEFVALAGKFAEHAGDLGKGFGWLDIFSERLKEVAERGVRVLNNYENGVPSDLAQEAVAFLDKLANMPTEYFEAKLQRSVDISEFKAAVIPNTTDKAARDVLKYARVPVFEYDPSVAGSRAAVMRIAAGQGQLLFQSGDVVDDAGFLAAENIITEYTRGNLTPAQARKNIKAMGWDIGPDGFRKKYGEIDLIDPEGNLHRTYGQSGDVRGARGSIRFPAAGVGNGDAVISLFQSADLSTFLHESGHYFLTVMQDLASRGEPNADADFAAVKSWWRENAADVAKDGMRVMPDVTLTADDVTAAIDTGSTGDVLKDAAIDVGMQEQWARAFETYLMEGKSPNVELRSAFEKFRAWLISVYQKLAGLNVNVSDDLRRVFDRMLASDDEIASAQTNSGGANPLFPTAEAMGLTQEEYDRFLKLRSQAEDDAKARLLKEVMAPIKRERDKWFKDERAKVRDEVERNVNALPAYRAIEWMGNRRWWGDEKPESLPDIRLAKDILVDRYGEGVLKTLPRGKQTVYAVEGGIDPDDAAGWFGFDSGDELVKAMERAPRRVDAIEAETDKEMRDRHGDVLLDGTAEAQALDAVHNDKRGQWIAAELKAIAEVAGVDVGMTAKEARHTARQTISRMRVRDAMAANRFLSAERKAGEEAARLGAMLAREGVWLQNARRRVAVKARAAMRGDGTVDAVPVQIEAANKSTGNYNETVTRLIEVKRWQLLNHALFMEARAVTDEVEKAERFVAKLGKRSTREKIAGAGRREDAGIDYLAAIDEIMERYDFRRMSGAAEQRRGALAAFVEAMKATGRENELAIPDTVLAAAARAPYKTIPVEELRGVIASLKNLEHVALRWNKLIDAQRERDLDQAVTAVTDAFEANVKKRPPSRVATKGEAVRNSVRQFLDLVLNATTLLREIDGFEDGGGAYQNIKAPIDDAMSRLIVRKERAAKDIEALYSVYSKDERRAMAVREHMPALGYGLSKWERIAVALNTGNAGNRQRLSDAKVRGSLTDDQIEAVLSTLDERDAKFVQSVWDYIGSFRDDIAARERRTTGNEPDWVEPSPVTIAGKVLKGGYYPIKYDPRLSSLARDDQANEIWQSMQAGRFGKAQTRNGHLKERAQSSGRAVEFDMSVMHRHINQVVYDLELSEAVSNSWRVLQDGRVRSAFMESGKQADFEALEAWLLDVGQGELRSADFVGRASRTLKSNFTAAKLAFNLSTVAMQVTGLAQSMVVVGKKNMVVGIRDAMRSGVSNEIASKSPYMSTRQTTFNKDIYDFYNDPKTGPVASKWGEIKSEIIGPLAFWLMTKVQWYLVDIPTWMAGYKQGLQKFGNDEAAAISHADDIVKRAQASGLFSDRSAVERGSVSRTARQNDVVRLFTALGSYMFAKFNVAYERTRKASRTISAEGVSTRSAQEALSWTLDMAFLFTLEAVLTAAIKGRLPGGDDDDDDDWMTFLARETGFSIMGTVPFVRDAASSLHGFNGGGAYGAVMDEFAKPFKQASQGEVDAALVKSVISATGLATGLPATQINRAVDAAWRQAEGKDVSPVEFLLGRR